MTKLLIELLASLIIPFHLDIKCRCIPKLDETQWDETRRLRPLVDENLMYAFLNNLVLLYSFLNLVVVKRESTMLLLWLLQWRKLYSLIILYKINVLIPA